MGHAILLHHTPGRNQGTASYVGRVTFLALSAHAETKFFEKESVILRERCLAVDSLSGVQQKFST